MTGVDDTIERLKKEKQRTNRLALNASALRERQRKETLKLKIQLGTLVMDAGLETEAISVIKGLLHEAAQTLAAEKGEQVRKRWRTLGSEKGSMKSQTTTNDKTKA